MTLPIVIFTSPRGNLLIQKVMIRFNLKKKKKEKMNCTCESLFCLTMSDLRNDVSSTSRDAFKIKMELLLR